MAAKLTICGDFVSASPQLSGGKPVSEHGQATDGCFLDRRAHSGEAMDGLMQKQNDMSNVFANLEQHVF
jgi:hypothetical protein